MCALRTVRSDDEGSLFDAERIHRAWLDCRRRKRGTASALRFEFDVAENLTLLAEEESSCLLGSYNSPHFDDARLRLCELEAERGRWDTAYEICMELAEIETSRLRDDALLLAARIEKEQGKGAKACRLLQRILAIERASAARESKHLSSDWGCTED